MTKKYDTLVYIGRFQPLHNAHVEIVRRATQLARQVVVIVGSAYQPRTYKNPWTSAERELMLAQTLGRVGDPDCALRIEHNIDTIHNDAAWAVRVQALVGKHTAGLPRTAIIGHDKDETTFYLKMFPQWERVEVPLIEPLNATDIRDLYFRRDSNLGFVRGVVPDVVYTMLQNFQRTKEFEQVVREREFIANYQKQYEHLPYAPIFVTVDAAVIQSGHILMIKRKSEPGKGLWALPGGFVNAKTDRSLVDAMLRELREETGIKVPAPVLRGNITASRVFDAIDRSARGRTITHAFRIQLPDGELPRVKGMDDAEKAQWVPIAEVRSEECFEDHNEIKEWAVNA